MIFLPVVLIFQTPFLLLSLFSDQMPVHLLPGCVHPRIFDARILPGSQNRYNRFCMNLGSCARKWVSQPQEKTGQLLSHPAGIREGPDLLSFEFLFFFAEVEFLQALDLIANLLEIAAVAVGRHSLEYL